MKSRLKMLILVVIALCTLLTACKKDDITIPKKEVSDKYADYDYSKRAFFGRSYLYPQIYQNKCYRMTGRGLLVVSDLNDISDAVNLLDVDDNDKDLEGDENIELLDYVCLCPLEEEHGHLTAPTKYIFECPVKMISGAGKARFTVDAHESAGSYPVIYFSDYDQEYKMTGYDDNGEEIYEFVGYRNPALYRYTMSDNKREKVITGIDGDISQFVIYGDKIYLVILDSSSNYSLLVYDKQSKKSDTLTIEEKGTLNIISADDDGIYFCNKNTGTVYHADSSLSSLDSIYTVDDMMTVPGLDDGRSGIMIDNGYLYYRSDFEKLTVQLHITGVPDDEVENPQYIYPLKYNIRRLPLDNLSGKGELVASDVFENSEYMIQNNSLYFSPADVGQTIDNYYYNFNSGRFCRVDLTTLEQTDVLNDSGLLFDPMGNYNVCNDKYAICEAKPVSDKVPDNYSIFYGSTVLIYDFETNAMYALSTT